MGPLITSLLLACAAFPAAAPLPPLPAPPPLSSLDCAPQPTTPSTDMPALANAFGSTGTGRDVLTLSGLALYPYAAAVVAAPAAGGLDVDGERVQAASHAWGAFSARRWGASRSGVAVASEARLVHEAHAALLRLDVAGAPAAPAALSLSLQNAVQRLPAYPWVTLPDTRAAAGNFTATLAGAGAALVTCDKRSAACAALWLVPDAALPFAPLALRAGETTATSAALLRAGARGTVRLALALGATAAEALAGAARLGASAEAFDAAWAATAAAAEARWLDAFTPKPAGGGGGHFSGALPVLATPSEGLARLYYTSVLAIVQAERTNLPQFAPRAYVTAAGNAVFLGAPWGPPQLVDIGGTAQYAWDQSFYAVLGALLDPLAQRADLLAWNNRNFSLTYGIELDDGALTGHFYAFNALSLWTSYAGYLRATNDSALLDAVDGAGSSDYLERLARDWERHAPPALPLFADYSGDPDAYLECVPTYKHATAGLQAAAAAMSRDLAELRERQGNATGAARLRARADAIARASIDALYVGGGGGGGAVGGWWAVMDTATRGLTEVRTVVDTVYTAAGFCSGRRAAWGCALSGAQRAQIAAFAREQLAVPAGGWIRALSLGDALRNVSRPDHGTTGSYVAWPALLFEALTALDGGFNGSVPFLLGAARAAALGPFGQANELDAAGVPFKTANGWTRALANNGGAFAEAILRTLFGFDPPWLLRDAARDVRPSYPGLRRWGLEGSTLTGIRLADGSYVDAELTEAGVAFNFRA